MTVATLLTSLSLLACSTAPSTAGPETTPTVGDGGATTVFEINDLALAVGERVGSVIVATWSQTDTATVWLEFRTDDGEWRSSPPTQQGPGVARELVLGVPYDRTVEVRVAHADGQSDALFLSTDGLPDGAPVAVSVDGDPDLWDDRSPYVLTSLLGNTDSVTGSWSVIVDREGQLVWALEGNRSRISMQTQLSFDGTELLIDQGTFWALFDGGEAAEIDRVDIEGAVLQTYVTPRLHHPFTQLPDGSIAWGQTEGYFEDESIAVLRPDGSTQVLWNCGDFLESEGAPKPAYCGSNTLSYSQERDSFLYSFFSIETLVEIDASTGQLLDYYGHTGRAAWGFDPIEAAFWWQHGAHFTDAGTILVSSKDSDDGTETVVREYSLDADAEALVLVASFGDGEGVFGSTMGEADYTAGGHMLHNYGSVPRLREFAPDGQVVWDVQWTGEFIGRSTPISDLYTIR